MTACLLLLGFASLVLGASLAVQIRARRRWLLGPLARHRGATVEWAELLASWREAGIGSAVAR